jgi:hypothetical protein
MCRPSGALHCPIFDVDATGQLECPNVVRQLGINSANSVREFDPLLLQRYIQSGLVPGDGFTQRRRDYVL